MDNLKMGELIREARKEKGMTQMDVPYDAEGWRPRITFEFLQWSEADPEKMLVFFRYKDTGGANREGYMWYDYGTGKSSGHMEIEQGEKAPDAFYGLIGDLMS